MNDNISKRPSKRKKGKLIALCILGTLFVAVVVLIVANLSVIRLVSSPEKIVIFEREESIKVLKRLEGAGDVVKLEIADDAGSVSFSNANESIRVLSEYDGGRLRRVSGNIDAGRVGVSTVEEGRQLARAMLSPYFTDSETTAILLRYSPDIISGGWGGDIDLSFDIGGNYLVSATGSAHSGVEFSITPK